LRATRGAGKHNLNEKLPAAYATAHAQQVRSLASTSSEPSSCIGMQIIRGMQTYEFRQVVKQVSNYAHVTSRVVEFSRPDLQANSLFTIFCSLAYGFKSNITNLTQNLKDLIDISNLRNV
jgi:hypothetical protein